VLVLGTRNETRERLESHCTSQKGLWSYSVQLSQECLGKLVVQRKNTHTVSTKKH
jgi:hypothetical protein